MAQTCEGPPFAKGDPGIKSRLAALDSSENSPSSAPEQVLSRNREQLAMLRESTWRVGDTAAIHLDLALGCLQVADDDGLTHHVGRAVNAMRAFAKLTNEISALRNGGAA